MLGGTQEPLSWQECELWGWCGGHIPHTPAIPPLGTSSSAPLTQVDKETCPGILLRASTGNSQGLETAVMPTPKGVDKSQGAYANDEHHAGFNGLNENDVY